MKVWESCAMWRSSNPVKGDHAPAVMIAFTVQWTFRSRLKIATSGRAPAPAPKSHMVLIGEAPMKT